MSSDTRRAARTPCSSGRRSPRRRIRPRRCASSRAWSDRVGRVSRAGRIELVVTEIKFCGLTRPEDARRAAELGAAYAGVIFAGGPRHLSIERAVQVLADVPTAVRRVGVFAGQSAAEIRDAVSAVKLDVVQLHAPGDPGRLERLRSACS